MYPANNTMFKRFSLILISFLVLMKMSVSETPHNKLKKIITSTSGSMATDYRGNHTLTHFLYGGYSVALGVGVDVGSPL